MEVIWGGLFPRYVDEHIPETIDYYYYYYSKSGKITCNLKSDDSGNEIVNIDAQKGWNKIYVRATWPDRIRTQEWTTRNILTKEAKWTLYTQYPE